MCQIQEIEADSGIQEVICALAPPRVFQREFVLVYEGQVPNFTLLLISGEISVRARKGTRDVSRNCLVGLREVLSGEPSESTITVRSDARVCLCDRQMLLETLESNATLKDQLNELSERG